MLAHPAIAQTRPGIFAGRPAALTEPVPVAEPAFVVRPAAPWVRSHLSFRGTRIFTALMLGWAGLILVAFGAFAVPAANDLGRAGVDKGLMSLLGSYAPIIWGLGIAHVIAAINVARDRVRWGFRLALWVLSAGVLLVAAGLVFSLAGRDPFALVDPTVSPATGTAVLTWALGLYALVGWGLRRVMATRRLI